MEQLLDNIVKEFYTRHGIQYKKNTPTGLLVHRYFSIRLRLISLKRRKIKVSKELSAKLATHICKDACFAIFEKNAVGADLNPHLSKNMTRSDEHDYLFNDWGLHHLHLNTDRKNHKYFVDRADFLLFAKFTKDTAYFLDVFKHAEDNVFSLKSLVKTLHNNWPEIIADRKTEFLLPDLTDEQIKGMRKSGYTFGVNVDSETGYYFLGHGYTASGDSLGAAKLANEVKRWMGQNQTLYDDAPERFEFELKRQLFLPM